MPGIEYLLNALSPTSLFVAVLGVSVGTIIGAMPGLTATMAVAVLVPFTFTLDPAIALITLGAIYTGAIYGGAYAAILLNTPGTPSSIATTFEGYPMAKRGDGNLALTLACLASVVGGLVGALCLLLLAPPLAQVALYFGPVEYFWLAIFGLTLIASLSEGNLFKALMGGCLGLLLSMVGVAEVGGEVRFTANMPSLLGGIDIVSALIGLYCVPVLLDLVASPTAHLQVNQQQGYRLKEAFSLMWYSRFNVLRSSVIGTVVGILPGAGGSIASLIAYAEAKRSTRHNTVPFGQGAVDGLVATESANNATVGGGFIPTLVLGIPGTPPDAVILGALLVQGVRVGPQLFSEHSEVVYTFIYGLLLATLLMLPVGLLIGRYVFRLLVKFPKTLLAPSVALLTILGTYAIHNNVDNVQHMVILGGIAWVMGCYGFSVSPIVLGLILGSIAESGFVQGSLIGMAKGNVWAEFLARPLSLGIIACIVLGLMYPFFMYRQKKVSV